MPDPVAASNAPPVRAGLARRLGAMFYDALLLVASLMVVTALLLPLTGGEAIGTARAPLLEFAYRALLVLVVVGFFGVPWTRSGQTLGLASWRLRVEREDGRPLTWSDTLRRLAWALVALLPLGLGFAWILFDAQHRAWHDRLSGTRVIVLPKR